MAAAQVAQARTERARALCGEVNDCKLTVEQIDTALQNKEIASLVKRIAAIDAGTYVSAGGHVHYLVWGRKPEKHNKDSLQ